MMMAIDYNDPGVMEEFNVIQLMEYDEVVAELAQSGVRAPADMGDMDVKLMLVELRTVMKGGGSGSSGSGSSSGSNDSPPTKFGSRFEEMLWTKPVFRDMYDALKSSGDHNRMNVAAEYCNEPEGARSRYMSSYGTFLDEVETALNARPEVTTPRVRFGGFPANMGEYGLRMTLEALGGIEDMSVQVSDDGITLVGEVQFESVEVAKVAIEQYDGMDMGMGDTLKMVSI
ncbi:hypothetical protein ACHAW5_001241 [Stephanodiscus triporus]|uniref:RRM domain-containing protein n=1 Tax=Stephanodiscus triporus TaxID=2934178 RepID=A0ABD3N2H9_9STRA